MVRIKALNRAGEKNSRPPLTRVVGSPRINENKEISTIIVVVLCRLAPCGPCPPRAIAKRSRQAFGCSTRQFGCRCRAQSSAGDAKFSKR